MSRYGWLDNYVEHDYRYDTNFLPYARWVECLEVIEEALVDEAYDKWERTAMIGFQEYLLSPDKKKPYLSFEQWRKSLGIVRPRTAGKAALTKQQEIERAHEQLKALGFGAALGKPL